MSGSYHWRARAQNRYSSNLNSYPTGLTSGRKSELCTLGLTLGRVIVAAAVILGALAFNSFGHLQASIPNRKLTATKPPTLSSTRRSGPPTDGQASAPTGGGTGGGVPPSPAGMHWRLTFDDEFTRDRSIRTEFWNGNSWKPIRGDPRGSDSGAGSTITTVSGGTLATAAGKWSFGRHLYWCGNEIRRNGQKVGFSCAMLLLSYNGHMYARDGRGTWTQWEGIPGDFTGLLLSRTNGVAFQPSHSPLVDGLLTTGSPNLNTAKFAQRFGYFEWRIKLPHDVHGEGDGLHPTIWLWPIGKTEFPGGCDRNNAEIDVTESVIGPNNQDHTFFTVHDYCVSEDISFRYPAPRTADLARDWHTVGLYWRNDGSAQGSVQPYFDGVPQGKPHTLDARDTLWQNGAYVIIQVDPCVTPPFNDGVVCDQTTNFTDNPFVIQYMRVWKLAPN